jgi:hypothetical protein
VETWPTAQLKVEALKRCRQSNPDDLIVQRALAHFQAQLSPAPATDAPPATAPAPDPGPAPAPAITPPPDLSLPSRPRRRGAGLWPVVILLAVVALCLVAVWVVVQPEPNRNALAIGASARAPALDIAIQAPVELDFKSRAEVFQLREAAVSRYPDLLARDYTPSDAVFGQIEDQLPWWGITGHFYYGSGERSIEGPAEETRFLLNPYLLVAAEFDGLFYSWDTSRVTEAHLRQPDFPFYCEASQLRWYPGEARAEVTYARSQCLARTNQWTVQRLGLDQAYFSLIAYNARDLNLNYLYVSYDDSRNIFKPDAPTSAYAIPHYIHRGGSCGYPGGCNNMSPDTPEISWLQISALPAQAVVRLWRQNPWSVERSPDMLFVINFN